MDGSTATAKQNGGVQGSVISDLDMDTETANDATRTSVPSQFQDVPLSCELPSVSSPDPAVTPTYSSDSEEAMYSVGSTPAGTPVRVPKSQVLNQQEQDVLLKMESQNELLHKLQSLEQRYESRDREFEAEKAVLEAKIQDLEQQVIATREEKDQTVAEVTKNLNQRLDQVTKQLNSTRKELESMVMKYAMSEKQILDANKRKEQAEKHLKDVLRDKDSLSGRVKALTSDKSSLTSALDKKITELAVHQKEMDRLHNEVKDRETKLKQSQQRLQTIVDAHDEAKEQLVNLNNVLDILKRELELSKHNELQTTEESDHSCVHQTDSCQTDVTVDHEAVNELLKNELESAKEQKHGVEEKLSQLRKLVDELRGKEGEQNQMKAELEKVTADLLLLRQENHDLVLKADEVSFCNRELQQEVDLHRQKEAEMLDLSERLREKAESFQNQRDNLELECQTWRERVQVLDDKLQEDMKIQKDMLDKHLIEVSGWQNRVNKLEEELNHSQSLVQQLRLQIDEIENDKRIISKKQTNVVKELNKEIVQLRKKLQVIESQPQPAAAASYLSVAPIGDGLSATSRTSSSSSLDLVGQGANSRDTLQTQEPVSSDSQSRSDENTDTSPSEPCHMDAIASLPDLDKGKLVERILKLQKTLAKRSEKMDFLEDHNHQLVEELKKKTRLIQYYLLREESGALTTAEMDRNKVMNKVSSLLLSITICRSQDLITDRFSPPPLPRHRQRELIRKGATTMSSLYKNTSESEMTLDLSLEINRKLQAVLEDTILKNITLKVCNATSMRCRKVSLKYLISLSTSSSSYVPSQFRHSLLLSSSSSSPSVYVIQQQDSLSTLGDEIARLNGKPPDCRR